VQIFLWRHAQKPVPPILLLGLFSALIIASSAFYLWVTPQVANAYTGEQKLLGTTVEIKVFGPATRTAAQAAFNSIKKTESLISKFNSKSEICLINNFAGESVVAVSPVTYNAVKQSVNFSKATNGYFDITIGPLADLWKCAIQNKALPEKDAIESARALVDWRQILLDDNLGTIQLQNPEMKLDLGGIGKGYAFDLAKKVLDSYHVQNALISCSSSIIAIGLNPKGKPWKIAIRNPRFVPNSAAARAAKEKPYLGFVELTNQALSTSGDYEQFTEIDGKRYCHIIDPKTGYPAQGIECVVIISKSAALADAYTTAVFAMGIRDGLRLINFGRDTEGMIVDSRGKVYTSIGFKLLKD